MKLIKKEIFRSKTNTGDLAKFVITHCTGELGEAVIINKMFLTKKNFDRIFLKMKTFGDYTLYTERIALKPETLNKINLICNT